MILLKKKGFTLIELMVVIAIIAVLAAVVTPQVFKQIQKGRVTAALSFVKAVKTAATSYLTDMFVWPGSCLATDCNTTPNRFVVGGSANWDGPYLDRWPSVSGSPWGSGYDWISDTAVSNIFGAPLSAPVYERYLQINLVPTADAQKIDIAIDGVLGSNSGMVRAGSNPPTWPPAGNPTVWVLISRDGPVA